MRVNKEDLDKLSQLDRIEFRQRMGTAEVDLDIGPMPWYVMIICSIFIVGGYLEIAESLIRLTLWLILFKVVAIIIGSMATSKRRTEIVREYFKVETKKRK